MWLALTNALRRTGFILSLLIVSPLSFAADDTPSKEAIDVIWLATAAALVFLMQAGFALLESGMTRSKNCVNVTMKNYMDLCVGTVVFWLFGYGLMFGVNTSGWVGNSAFAMHDAETWDYSFLLFQTMFAATAATIASGSMAERAKFGSWAWGSAYEGKGWLAELGFIDFAGSTVVHSVGGWCALAGIIVLGPRLGRFDQKGRPREIPGHNLNYVALGGFILWFGWFGFNGGSTVSADVKIGLINLNTQLAAAAGAISGIFMTMLTRTPVLVPQIVNGSIAGLVGITAGCASMEPMFAIITGFLSGAVAYIFANYLLSVGLDDVVGAVSVHAAAGACGTICAGVFYSESMFDMRIIIVQLIGVFACFVWTFTTAFVMFKLIDKLFGLRVLPIHEQRGLDFTEHAEVAYPEFMEKTFYTKANLESVER